MKKVIALILSTIALLTILTSCSKTGETTNETTVASKKIVVGASVTPHAEILNFAKDLLAKDGYELEVKEYTDYVIPNTATDGGDILANYFQHQPYLTDFNNEKGTKLVSVASIHYEPFGIYAGKSSSLKDIKDGATIAVPNDGSNEARALLLLEKEGLIKLKDGVTFTATALDIAQNPKNLQIKEIEAAQLPRSLDSVDFAVINGNYAIQADLKVEDAVALEDKASNSAQTYANILVVKEGNENNEAVKALVKVLKSKEVTEFINDTYNGAVVPLN